jgi:uncharacterized protein YbjT (DUF2867 family)
VERYIEWSGFLLLICDQDFMQNLLSYGGKKSKQMGFHHYVSGARLSWVDVDNVAEVAALTLAFPELHAGKTYRLGYDAKF